MLTLDSDSDRQLVNMLARNAVEKTRPTEAQAFDDLAKRYYEDPAAFEAVEVKPEGGLQSGMGAVLQFVTPATLVAAKAVLIYVGSLILEEIEGEAVDAVKKRLKRWLKGEAVELPDFSTIQLSEMKSLIQTAGEQHGLEDQLTKQLSDSFINLLIDKDDQEE